MATSRIARVRCASGVFLLLAIISTSGCGAAEGTTSDPTPSSEASPSSSPTVSPSSSPSETTVDTIVFEAGQVVLLSGGTELTTLPMTELEPTLSTLTELLGASVSTPGAPSEDPQSPWQATPYTHSWGGGDLTLYESVGFIPTEYAVDVISASITGASGDPISLAGPGNVRVGDDITALIASTPVELQQTSAGPDSPLIILEEAWEDSPATVNKNGVGAFTTAGVVNRLRVPVSVPSLD